MEIFRKFFRSRIGAVAAIALLVLIALAFAGGDIANTGSFGGVAGGNRVATVGDERIDTSTLSQAATTALERVKDDQPTISMKSFLSDGGLEQVLDDLVARLAIAVFGKDNGIVAGDRLIDSEIAQMPVFRGADGKFSDDLFRQMMQQRGVSEQLIRDDLRQGLIARQVMLPASTGATMPMSMAKRYAELLRERRTGEIAVLPSLLFAPKEKPTEKQLAAYYAENRDDFIRPERRVIRYATFGPEVLKDVPEPTEAEIAYRYNADKAKYEAREKRRITQTIVPTEAAAKALAGEVSDGASLEKAAEAKGLSATRLEFFSKAELSGQFSAAVADAVFAAGRGKIAAPARSGLGWHVIRVEEIDSRPARTLDQVRGEIAKTISEEKRRVALTEMLERIEDGFDEGENLAEVAASLGVEPKSTPPLTADGNVYMKPGQTAPKEIEPIIDTAFSMEQEEPQLAEVERGKTFAIYDVTEVAESATAPLKDIEDMVRAAYVVEKASAEAKKAALKVQEQIGKGKSMREALASLKKRLPPVQPLSMTRPELSRLQQQRQQVPPPIALMFNMAEGTTKAQQAPNRQAWFVVSLKKIEPGKIEDDDQIIKAAQRELGSTLASEYTDALGRAISKEIGVEKNPAGIRAVREQLGGGV